MTDLGTLPGGTYSVAMGINARGDIVGVADTSGSANHAFLYANGAMQDLGTLPGGVFSEALGINDKGDVVGDALTANGHFHAVLWTR